MVVPIYLPPITRRRFLAGAIAAGATLALKPKLFGGTRAVDPDSWALFSDIHLAADKSLNARGINMTDHFRTVSREVLDLPEAPAAVFVTGDCAHNSGQTGDYAVVADLLKPIRQARMPVHLMLGNHDNRERFWEAFAAEKAAKRPLVDRQVALVSTPRANWFILDSLEKTLSTPGLLGREQLDWLGTALDAHADKAALVLVHHNPELNGGNMGIKDTASFYEVIRPRKQVKAYIYGHTHNWKVEQDSSGIHLVNLPPVAYVFQPGKPAGWVHMTLGSEGMKLELRCIDTKHPEHGQVHNLKWRA